MRERVLFLSAEVAGGHAVHTNAVLVAHPPCSCQCILDDAEVMGEEKGRGRRGEKIG